MRTITVNKAELHDKIKQNRDKHLEDYRSARIAWERKVNERLDTVLGEARRGDYSRVQSPVSDLPKPEHFTDSYNSAIEQLKWEQNDTVELDESEFQQYVLNNWSWNHRFLANTTSYLAK